MSWQAPPGGGRAVMLSRDEGRAARYDRPAFGIAVPAATIH